MDIEIFKREDEATSGFSSAFPKETVTARSMEKKRCTPNPYKSRGDDSSTCLQGGVPHDQGGITSEDFSLKGRWRSGHHRDSERHDCLL